MSCEVHALLWTRTPMPVHTLCRPLPSCLPRGRWPLCRAGSWIRASSHDHDEKRAEACPGQSSLPTAGRSRDGYCRSARPPELRTPACPPRGAALLSWPFSWRSYTNSSLCTFHRQQPDGEGPGIPAWKAQAFCSWGRNRAPHAARTGGVGCPGAPVAVLRPNPGSAAKTAVGVGVGAGGQRPALPGEGQERPLAGSSASGRPHYCFSPCSFQPRLQRLFSSGPCVLDKFTS